MSDILTRLSEQIDRRKGVDSGTSYTASLFARGEDTILKKVGEEAVESLGNTKRVRRVVLALASQSQPDPCARFGLVADSFFT